MKKVTKVPWFRKHLVSVLTVAVLVQDWGSCGPHVVPARGGWLFGSGSSSDSDKDSSGDGGGNGGAASAIVKGVSLQQEKDYIGLKFRCQSDRSMEIPIEFVNDDYCDCADGSDEPGTSACSGSGDLSLFYCVNEGFKEMNIPTGWVGDGICDCCDGTDEAAGVCTNTCKEDGIEYRAEMERVRKVQKEGLALKADFIKQAKEALQRKDNAKDREKEIDEELQKLKQQSADLQESIDIVEEIEEAKAMKAERALNLKRIKSLRLDELNSTELQYLVVQAVSDRILPSKLEALVKDLLKEKEMTNVQVSPDGSVEKVQVDSSSESVEDVKWLDDPSGSAYGHDDYGDAYDENDDEDDDDGAKDEGKKSELDSLVDEKEDIDEKIRTLEKEKEELNKDDGNDYGPENVWWPLKDKCFEVRADGYNYKMCPFGRASQDHTSLGTWSGFDENSDYKVFRFEKGQRCWNGPLRSLTIYAKCGNEQILSKVSEPSKCEYSAEFETPAAC